MAKYFDRDTKTAYVEQVNSGKIDITIIKDNNPACDICLCALTNLRYCEATDLFHCLRCLSFQKFNN